MPNSYFQFKQFIIHQDKCAMKVTTDACLFGAWIGDRILSRDAGAGNQNPKICDLLEIGTGTGLLSLMLAQKDPSAFIDAVEIDKDAFEQASENVAASPWPNRIRVIQADAKGFLSTHKYDVIISNPPFYENELKSDEKKKNIAHHSDDLTLLQLLSVIKKNLESTGSFYLLLPYKRHKEIKELLLDNEFAIIQMTGVRQSVDHGYFRVMLSGRFQSGTPGETVVDEIAITDEKGQYGSAFVSLLKDYYLHL